MWMDLLFKKNLLSLMIGRLLPSWEGFLAGAMAVLFSLENKVGPVVLSHASYFVSSKSLQVSFIGSEAT